MPKLPEALAAPNEDMQEAWRMLNTALAHLAMAYSVDLDELNTHVGRYTEEVISVLLDDDRDAE
jgi:hypothetical protein